MTLQNTKCLRPRLGNNSYWNMSWLRASVFRFSLGTQKYSRQTFHVCLIVFGSGTARSYNRTRGQGLYGYGTRKNQQYQARWEDL